MAVIEHQNFAAATHNTLARAAGHTTATGAIILSWIHVLGDVASATATCLACVWYGVTLYESETGKKIVAWVKNRKPKE